MLAKSDTKTGIKKENVIKNTAHKEIYKEGRAVIEVPDSVFYNPFMELNRDIAVIMLNILQTSIDKKSIKKKSSNTIVNVADIMAGSGVRSIRFALELDKLKKSKINDKLESSMRASFRISANDLSEIGCNSINENAALNNIKIRVSNKDAAQFLYDSKGFDYIEIDPFGSPVPYLDAACARISREGMIAITATDTAALSGTNINACMRKYLAIPMRNELMHEAGMRILIRRAQIAGAAHEKALIPLLCHSTRHYMRVYFLVHKGRQKVDEVMKKFGYIHHCSRCRRFWIKTNHGTNYGSIGEVEKNKKIAELGEKLNEKVNGKLNEKANIKVNEKICACNCACSSNMDNSRGNTDGTNILSAGPLWLGRLWDVDIIKDIASAAGQLEYLKPDTVKLLSMLLEESKINTVGFFDIHAICKANKLNIPRMEALMQRLKAKGFDACRTHFSQYGVRSNCSFDELIRAIIETD